MTEDFGYFPFLETTPIESARDDFLCLDEPLLAYAGYEAGKPQDRSVSGCLCDLVETTKSDEGTAILLNGHPHSIGNSLVGEDRMKPVDVADWTPQTANNCWKEWNVDVINGSEDFLLGRRATETVDLLIRSNPKEVWTTIEDHKQEKVNSVERMDHFQCDCYASYPRHNEDWRSKEVHESWEGCNEHFMTLPLCILEFMRNIGRPVTEEEILEQAKKKYSILRKSDGSRYKENQIRAVKGSLCSTGIFMKADQNGKEWIVNEEAAKQYEAKMLQKHGNLSRKWHSWNTRKGVFKRTRKLGMDCNREDGVTMEGQWMIPKCCPCFYSCSCCHDEDMEMPSCSQWNWLLSISNDMIRDPRWNDCFENPFRGCKFNCSLKELEESMGTEKLTHVMQTFHWLRELFMCSDLKQSQDRIHPTSPMKMISKTNHSVSSPCDQPYSSLKHGKCLTPCAGIRNEVSLESFSKDMETLNNKFHFERVMKE
ncbi:hypothetical protein GpartN1_g2684.t1 [Galdieria partita]|uniref:Uncharacterized protein n=1 Tax=Galdieria partita TaxID=83374 RepID=A0A9C7PU73_9RHOD|nr:hypothetical protein GpartN1_g2684.t1 [Galdieria partita]